MSEHLDRCEEEQQQAAKSAKPRPRARGSNSRPTSSQTRPVPERISELNYSMLTDAKLRQKLAAAGIPSTGTKQLMIKRHTEWVNLWNANCDSGGKKTQRELLRDLDAWERTQGGKAPNASGLSSTIMRKDFDGTGWAKNNKQDFSRLIADAKRLKNNPASEESRPKETNADAVIIAASDEDATRPTQQSSPPKLSQEHADERPYDNNPDALASLRKNVAAANEGRHIEPQMNAGFEGIAAESEGGGPNSIPPLTNGNTTAHGGLASNALLAQSNSVTQSMTTPWRGQRRLSHAHW